MIENVSLWLIYTHPHSGFFFLPLCSMSLIQPVIRRNGELAI